MCRVDVSSHHGQALARQRQRQKVVVDVSLEATPGEMFRDQWRAQLVDQLDEPVEVGGIQRFGTAQRLADAITESG